MKTKILATGAAIVVSALVAAACSSSDSGDSEPDPTAAAVPASAPDAVTATPGTETTSTTPTAAPTSTTASAASTSTAPTTASASTTPATGPTASTSSTSITASSVPAETSEPAASASTTSAPTETSQPPASTSTTSASSTAAPPPATTAPVVEDLAPAELRVQVLNGSGIAGAAGRLSARLRDAGYDVLPAGNAPSRFSSSAVYYVASAHQDEAETVAEVVAETAENSGEIAVANLPSSGQIPSGTANVIVLIGADTLGTSLRTAETASGLRRTPRTNVALPLPDDVPRDRYVPGLTDIQIFSQVNDEGSGEVKGALNALSGWFNIAGRYLWAGSQQLSADLEDYMDYDYLQEEVWPNIERTLEYFGFTPQNTCGAPAGYSFTDLIKPTREFDPETQNYTGDAIFTTDRLLELHGGQRINPSENLDYYIRQAVQTAHDELRTAELVEETETFQLILCLALTAPESKLPEFANSLWYGQFIPGVQPRESLLSQGTYHVKEISRNGNIAHVVVCHPTLGERHILLHWREAGYRAELLAVRSNMGCQAGYENETYIYEDTNGAEDTFRFGFGERVFSASDLSEFPRG